LISEIQRFTHIYFKSVIEMIETNLTKMFGIKYPIIAAPMGPFYTTKLTVAVSEAGGLGVLSHTNLENKSSIKEMQENLQYVVDHTDKPFGLNIRTSRMQPDALDLVREIPRFIAGNQKMRDQCVYMLTSAGSATMLPKSKQFTKLKEAGSQVKHFHVAPSLELAQKCVTAGVDGLVVTGTEGGGHQSYEKVSTLVLMQQVQQALPDVPKVACGGFATGQSLAAALMMGYGAIAMGTRFIASQESEFHPNYKAIVPPAKADETDLFTGFFGPIRLWKNEFTKSHALVATKEEKMAEENEMSAEDLIHEKNSYEVTYNGDIQHGAVLLGQSIGIINAIENVPDIIARIMKEAEGSLKSAASFLK
jgi:NAD(P)H-dependent flavin oxidoreductase YrpB (nitropropane dioxygenase family)